LLLTIYYLHLEAKEAQSSITNIELIGTFLISEGFFAVSHSF